MGNPRPGLRKRTGWRGKLRHGAGRGTWERRTRGGHRSPTGSAGPLTAPGPVPPCGPAQITEITAACVGNFRERAAIAGRLPQGRAAPLVPAPPVPSPPPTQLRRWPKSRLRPSLLRLRRSGTENARRGARAPCVGDRTETLPSLLPFLPAGVPAPQAAPCLPPLPLGLPVPALGRCRSSPPGPAAAPAQLTRLKIVVFLMTKLSNFSPLCTRFWSFGAYLSSLSALTSLETEEFLYLGFLYLLDFSGTCEKNSVNGGGTAMAVLACARCSSSSSSWCSFLGAGAPNPLCFWTPMDAFWIPRLTILVLLHQTTSASDTTELTGAVGGSVTFHSHNPDRNVALWNFGNDPIVTVVFKDPPRLIFFEDKFKTRFAVSENGLALSISQLRTEDAGTYSVIIGDERSTFTLQVFRELAELTVTCEAQNCSDGSCSCCLRCSAPADTGSKECFKSISSTLAQQVKELSQKELKWLNCTAQNPVRKESVTITSPGELCAGAHSSSWIWISIIAVLEVVAFLSIFLMCYRKSKGGREPKGCRVCSLWGRAKHLVSSEEPNTWLGSKIDTKGAEHACLEKQIFLQTNKTQAMLSSLWPGDGSLASPTQPGWCGAGLRFLPQPGLPPGVSQCHSQAVPPGVSQCHSQAVPPGVSQCHQQPRGRDQHQEQP